MPENKVFGQAVGERRGESEVYCYPESMPARIFTCSHITFAMVYSFYFLCFGTTWNEWNSLWEDKGGKVRSLLLARKVSLSWNFIYPLSHYTVAMLSPLCWLFSSFTDDKMILQAIAVHDIFIIILSQYIVFINACHTLHDAHLAARMPRRSWI